MALTELPPLTLYIHYPWCKRRCPYCDFNAYAVAGQASADSDRAYVDQLLADLDNALPQIWGRRLSAIFMGGGTPSLLAASELTRLLTQIRARFNPAPDIEITLEANPGTAEQARFAAYFAAGVNRLSLGVQSFSDTHLRRLGRIHNAAEAETAIKLAKTTGFSQINIDLMFALPQQTVAQAVDDLQRALDFAPAHLSWYQLTLEEETPFGRQPPPGMADDELCWQISRAGEDLLAAAGYEQYEVSAYAQKGYAALSPTRTDYAGTHRCLLGSSSFASRIS
ncbi:MAG: radical SAM family heme chaperone HemW [Gammaproteobacteria bacterium]|nr:radical SAM family heme chaperone HemW [Gammaproteobacteria bacterium]